MDNQSTVKTTSKAKKVWGIIGNVLMWLFIAFAVVITIFAFSAQSSADGVPTIGGKVMSPVLSNSMSPTIKEGDIIFSRKLADEEKTSLKVDDIITFKVDLDGDGTPEVNTHRISEVIGSGSSVTYRTKGDNNAIADTYTISAADVISIFDPAKDTRIPVLGSVIKFLLTPTGFFVVIVIPLIIFFLFEIIMFVRKIMEVKNAGKKQITAEDEELIKQKAIEEYIRSQKAQSGEDNEEPKTEKEAEAPAETTGEEQTKTTEE
ncbi:MAG: signal peptidase I [Clostridia bacterium]|nr:signal peptidase I [Clostridia bacterium]